MTVSKNNGRGRWLGALAVLAVVAVPALAFADAPLSESPPPPELDPAVAAAIDSARAESRVLVDRVWVLVAACLVFFMQCGFLALEVGFVRRKAIVITAMKSVVGWTVCVLTFFFVGWGMMFGHTQDGLIGGDAWMLESSGVGGNRLGIGVHFLFNLALCGTSAAIVSGAMAERTGFIPYVLCSMVITALIYPVVGHWVWGNSYYADNSTLLTQWGFIDFAGSTVVHSVGGWVALIGVIVIGPRIGRFDGDGRPVRMGHYSLAWSGLGVFFLWFGWWGFNGGSTLTVDGDKVAMIIANTNIAAAAGGLVAMLHGKIFQSGRDLTAKFMGGLLIGLVSVTANCHMISPVSALAIGAVAGVLHNLALEGMLKLNLDDPVGAIPVHLAGGIWGTLAVGIFGKADMLGGNGRLEQIGVQALGIGIVGVYTVFVTLVAFLLFKQFVGLRVSPIEELAGFEIGGAIENPDDELAADLNAQENG